MSFSLTRSTRRPGVDPLLALCGTVALVVYLLRGFDGPLSRDMGVYAYAGQQFADGTLPYAGILNRAGPLAHAVPGIGAWVARHVGVDDLLAMRVLMMLLSVAVVMATYRLARDLFAGDLFAGELSARDRFDPRLAGLVAAAAMLCFQGFASSATDGPREKTTMVLFLVLALLATSRQWWATCGALVALATLTWQPVVLPALAGVTTAVLLGSTGHRARAKALARVALGGLAPTAVVVGAYAVSGRLRLLVDDFYLINARYTRQDSVLDHPAGVWDSLLKGYGWTVWVLLGGSLAVLVLGAVAVRRRTRCEPPRAALAALAVTVLVNLAWSAVAFNGWPDAFVALPAAAVGTGGALAALRGRLPRAALRSVAVGWSVLAVAAASTYAVTGRYDGLSAQRDEAEAVLARLPDGARLLSVESPQPLVLLHRRNPSRLQLFGNGLVRYVDDTWPGGSEGYGRWIEDQGYEVLSVGKPLRRLPWLEPVVERSYLRLPADGAQFHWYVRRDLPPADVAALRTLLRHAD